jgi:hypothetical protein
MPMRVTQVVAEVLRGRVDAGQFRVTQVVLEVMVPHAPPPPDPIAASATSTVQFSHPGGGVAGAIITSADATNEVAFAHPDGGVTATMPVPVSAESTVEFGTPDGSPSGDVVQRVFASSTVLFGEPDGGIPTPTLLASVDAESTVVFSHPSGSPSATGDLVASASSTVIFASPVRLRVPEVAFGEVYRGRFQVGKEYPLLVVAKNEEGRPREPDAAPIARIYSESGLVESVEVSRLRASGQVGLFAMRHKLGRDYEPGRHWVLYSFAIGNGTFNGFELDIFEVDAGGDAAGASVAAQLTSRPEDDVVLAQLLGGALVSGRRPKL